MPVIVAAVLWTLILTIAYCKQATPKALFWLGAVGMLAGVCTFLISVMVLSLVLILTSVILGASNPTPRRRLHGLLAAVGVALACLVIPATYRTYRRLQLRSEHPFVSLRDRVTPVVQTPYIVQGAIEPSKPARSHRFAAYLGRTRAIEKLHRSAVAHFLETPEFGVSRMGYPRLDLLEEPDGSPIKLPSTQAEKSAELASGSTPLHFPAMPVYGDLEPLQEGHQRYTSWFMDEERLGLIRDLDHVAGFQSHGIFEQRYDPWGGDLNARFNRENPRANTTVEDQYELLSLQLVGLLYHPQPVVYELDTLPELLSAATAPTRSLDAFEETALKGLLAGKPVHARQSENEIRMLGALRSSSECAECHEGPTNQLLGAFSYVLRSRNEAGTRLTYSLP